MAATSHDRPRRLLSRIGPGMLVAATGVGAGDLATGAFTGSKLGMAILWVVVLGAFFKFVLNEGLARWQLVTDSTFLEGAARHFGPLVHWGFLAYLLLWTVLVGSALMSACGVAGTAIFNSLWPGSLDPVTGKRLFGFLHSLAAVVLIVVGGYRLFEKVMSVCIVVMFVTVVSTAVLANPSWPAAASGLFVPTIPDAAGGGLEWSIALMGGVGGTLTVLCYGYWIREEGRTGAASINACRADLATGYAVTAFFGMGMVILATGMETHGKGATLIVDLADQLSARLGDAGPAARWAFLVGAWGAVASSLLGVWQSVPYLFADVWGLIRSKDDAIAAAVDTTSPAYRGYLFFIATIPALGLFFTFEVVQKINAIIGAICIPMLALGLLFLNGSRRHLGEAHCNTRLTNAILVIAVLLSMAAGYVMLAARFGW